MHTPMAQAAHRPRTRRVLGAVSWLIECCIVAPGLRIVGPGDECKTHLCFEFISHAILCILYPYSCKTHKISSKLGFVGLLMKIK